MKWSFKLGRLLGIDVHIHFTFLILLVVIGFAHWVPDRSVSAALGGLLFFALLFVCVLLHEFGHALMARRFGLRTRDITLLPIGGVARLERTPEKPAQELLVALAGPAVNVIIALALGAWLLLAHAWQPVSSLKIAEGGMIERLLAVNAGLVLFNMLPAFPMDGGRVLRAVLAMKMNLTRATIMATRAGKVMAVLFVTGGVFTNPMLILIALVGWCGASQEHALTQVRSVVAGASVRDAMVTSFHTVSPSTTLQEMAALMLSGAQRDYPVMTRQHIIGMLSHADLLRAMRTSQLDTNVITVMRTDVPTLDEDELLDDLLLRDRGNDETAMPVLKHGVLVGLLTAQHRHAYFIIREAHCGIDLSWSRGVRVVRDSSAT